MRHGKKFNHLSRKSAHRKAMLANMACSLIEHKRIKTTLAKAKALRQYVEPLITKSKKDTTHSRRIVFSYLKQKDAITELFGDVSSKVAERAGGYTRILKLSNRLGDNAQMAYIELVDYNEDYTTNKPKRKKARRAKKKKVDSLSANVEKTDQIEDAIEVNEAAVEDVSEKNDVSENKQEEVEDVSEKNDVSENKQEEVEDVSEKNDVSENKQEEVEDVSEKNDVIENTEGEKKEANNSEDKKEKGE